MGYHLSSNKNVYKELLNHALYEWISDIMEDGEFVTRVCIRLW